MTTQRETLRAALERLNHMTDVLSDHVYVGDGKFEDYQGEARSLIASALAALAAEPEAMETTAEERAETASFLEGQLKQGDEARANGNPHWPEFKVASLHVTRVLALLRDLDRLLLEREAVAAVKRLDARQGEDVEAWAATLAGDLVAAGEIEREAVAEPVAQLRGSGWKHQCCQVADAARQEGYEYGLSKIAAAVAAENEAFKKIVSDHYEINPGLESEPLGFHSGWETCVRSIDAAIRARRKAPAGESKP
jgi:hypothetical protein